MSSRLTRENKGNVQLLSPQNFMAELFLRTGRDGCARRVFFGVDSMKDNR